MGDFYVATRPERIDAVHPEATFGSTATTEERLLALAAAVQSRSEPHLAQATVDAAESRGLGVPSATGIPLPLAVGGHEGSTVVVSLNGLRLLRYR